MLEQPATTNELDDRQQIPLLSLPKLFGTELTTIPSVTPYITPKTPPPPSLQVSAPPAGLSIGVVWATNPQNKAMYRNKSCPLALLMPKLQRLMDLELIDLHALQVGRDASQLDPWREHPRLKDWSDQLSDFSDTAHVIQQLDLIISVGHGRGSLGRRSEPPHLASPTVQCRFPLVARSIGFTLVLLDALVPPAHSSRLAGPGGTAQPGLG